MKYLKGEHSDTRPIDQPEGTVRHMRNIVLNQELGSMISEPGNQIVHTLSNVDAALQPLHALLIDKDRKVIFSTKNGVCEIGILDRFNQYTVVRQDSDYNFKEWTNFDCDYWVDNCGETVVYFTDNENPVRFINIDNPSTLPVDYSNVFHFVGSMPKIELEEVEDFGGSLTAGAYYIAVAYVDEEDNTTNYLTISPAVYIGNKSSAGGPDNYDGAVEDTPTSKSIRVRIDNIDLNYKRLKIAYIPQYGGVISSPLVLPDVNIVNASYTVTITGGESTTETALEDVIVPNAYYDTAKSLTIYNKRMHLANLTRRPDIGAQPYVNGLEINETVKTVQNDFLTGGLEDYPKEPVNSFYDKSYKADEVYAFYIQFILKNGQRSVAYHIPGRKSKQSLLYLADEKSNLQDVIDANATSLAPNLSYLKDMSVDSNGASTVRLFQVIADGVSSAGMGYWENEDETYSNEEDWIVKDSTGAQIDDLRGTNVRHHKFSDWDTLKAFQNGTMQIRGFKIVNFLDQMPQEILDQIQAYEIYYAKRTADNSTKLGQGLTFAVPAETLPLAGGDTDVWIPRAENYPGLFPLTDPLRKTAGAVTMFPFDIMVDPSYLRQASYLKVVDCLKAYGGVTNVGTPARRKVAVYRTSIQGKQRAKFRALKAKAIIPLDNDDLINTTPLGFTLDTYNVGRKGAAFLEFLITSDLEYDTFGWYPALDSPIPSQDQAAIDFNNIQKNDDVATAYLADVCAYKKNVYNSFKNQELVWTGYRNTDLGQVSDDIFGGDIFISRTAHLGSEHTTGEFPVVSPDDGGVDDPFDPSENHRCIHDVVAECRFNAGMRHEGEVEFEYYYPKNPFSDVLDIPSNVDNYWGYTLDYHAEAQLMQHEIYSEPSCNKNFEHRIIRSARQELSQQEELFRTFLANDYIDVKSNRGPITSVEYMGDQFIIHLQNGLLLTKGNERIKMDTVTAFVGSGDIFAIDPTEPVSTEEGYAGMQHATGGVSTRFGRFWVDTLSRRVFGLTSGLVPVSDAGLSNWFMEHLPFALEGRMPSDMPYRRHGIDVVYDPDLERILITKEEWIPTAQMQTLLDAGWIYNKEIHGFQQPTTDGPIARPVLVEEGVYFTHNSWTRSYYPADKAWGGLHDYSVLVGVHDSKNFYTWNNSGIYEHQKSNLPGNFYGTVFPSEIEIIGNEARDTTKQLSSFESTLDILDADGNQTYSLPFSNYVIFNSYQCSGLISVSESNTEHIGREWRFNRFRDIVSDHNLPAYVDHAPLSSNLDVNLPWYKRKRFNDKWNGIKIVHNNLDNKALYLYSLTLKQRIYVRET